MKDDRVVTEGCYQMMHPYEARYFSPSIPQPATQPGLICRHCGGAISEGVLIRVEAAKPAYEEP